MGQASVSLKYTKIVFFRNHALLPNVKHFCFLFLKQTGAMGVGNNKLGLAYVVF